MSIGNATNAIWPEPPERHPLSSLKRHAPARSALPKISALLVSLVLHASTAAGLVLSVIPVEPLPEPQPMAIMVDFVPESAAEEQVPQTVPKGERMAAIAEEAIPEEITSEQPELPTETGDVAEFEKAPDRIPVPLHRPKPAKPKTEPQQVAVARGLGEESRPDMVEGEAHKAPGKLDAVSGEETSHGLVQYTEAQERWQMRLAAHLEKRKRYPRQALSHHRQGTVHVRFRVAPDGTVAFPELVRSSGEPDLDAEVMDLVQRASPLPRPPTAVNTLVVVPIAFTIRR